MKRGTLCASIENEVVMVKPVKFFRRQARFRKTRQTHPHPPAPHKKYIMLHITKNYPNLNTCIISNEVCTLYTWRCTTYNTKRSIEDTERKCNVKTIPPFLHISGENHLTAWVGHVKHCSLKFNIRWFFHSKGSWQRHCCRRRWQQKQRKCQQSFTKNKSKIVENEIWCKYFMSSDLCVFDKYPFVGSSPATDRHGSFCWKVGNFLWKMGV